jgi:hypothetical protein
VRVDANGNLTVRARVLIKMLPKGDVNPVTPSKPGNGNNGGDDDDDDDDDSGRARHRNPPVGPQTPSPDNLETPAAGGVSASSAPENPVQSTAPQGEAPGEEAEGQASEPHGESPSSPAEEALSPENSQAADADPVREEPAAQKPRQSAALAVALICVLVLAALLTVSGIRIEYLAPAPQGEGGRRVLRRVVFLRRLHYGDDMRLDVSTDKIQEIAGMTMIIRAGLLYRRSFYQKTLELEFGGQKRGVTVPQKEIYSKQGIVVEGDIFAHLNVGTAE